MRLPETATPTSSALRRWRLARRGVLSAILVAGAMVTTSALMSRMWSEDQGERVRMVHAYSYGGVGIVIEALADDSVMVSDVIPNSPAAGRIHPGARLVSVDGVHLRELDQWSAAIRGAPGTSVQLEIAYRCGGHERLELVRDLVRVSH